MPQLQLAPIGNCAVASYCLKQSEFLLDRPVSLVIGSDESFDEEPDELSKRFPHDTQSYWSDWTILSAHRLSRTWEQGLWHAS